MAKATTSKTSSSSNPFRNFSNSEKCFMCCCDLFEDRNPQQSKSKFSSEQECSFILAHILEVSQLETYLQRMREETLKISYCDSCLMKIKRIRDILDELEKLERILLDEKYQIEVQFRRNVEKYLEESIQERDVQEDDENQMTEEIQNEILRDLRSTAILSILDKIQTRQIGRKAKLKYSIPISSPVKKSSTIGHQRNENSGQSGSGSGFNDHVSIPIQKKKKSTISSQHQTSIQQIQHSSPKARSGNSSRDQSQLQNQPQSQQFGYRDHQRSNLTIEPIRSIPRRQNFDPIPVRRKSIDSLPSRNVAPSTSSAPVTSVLPNVEAVFIKTEPQYEEEEKVNFSEISMNSQMNFGEDDEDEMGFSEDQMDLEDDEYSNPGSLSSLNNFSNMESPLASVGALALGSLTSLIPAPKKTESDSEPDMKAHSSNWLNNLQNDDHDSSNLAAFSMQHAFGFGMGGFNNNPPGQNQRKHRKKKSGFRENPFSHKPYADLISLAIQSSPHKRLTLQEIYNWMVANVPEKVKIESSNGSTVWKNTIRHNLSVHDCFVRVRNEGAKHSSFWTVKPDVDIGKISRKRTTE